MTDQELNEIVGHWEFSHHGGLDNPNVAGGG